MIIFRAIYLNLINELNKLNFGCHWTNDEFYANSMEFSYNDISENGRQGQNQYLFKTEIDKNQINELATIKSNKKHSIENECVLKKEIVLKKVVLIYPKEYLLSFTGNTGTRYDKWVE